MRIGVFEARDGSLVGLDRVGRASPRRVGVALPWKRTRKSVRTSAVREPRCAEAQEARRAAPVAHSRSARRCERILSLVGSRSFPHFTVFVVSSLNRLLKYIASLLFFLRFFSSLFFSSEEEMKKFPRGYNCFE